jgi:RNA recognition motif-containing protein
MKKYGEIKQVIRQQDEKGRSKGWVFVEYATPEAALKAIEDSGRANIMGRKLQINYKISKVKVVEDRDCWFCIDNPKIEKHLIIKQGKHFYSALPKGPVCDEHFLIIPNKHIAHSLELDES